MIVPGLVVLGLCLAVGVVLMVWRRMNHALGALPTPLPTPYLLRQSDLSLSFADLLKKISRCKHDTFCMWLGQTPWVFIKGTEDVQNVLINSKSMEKSEEYNLFKFAIGDGLFTCKMSRWKITRGYIQPLVHPRNLEHLVPGMNQRSQEIATKLSALVGKGQVDLYDTMFNFAVWNVLHLTLGPDLGYDTDSNAFRCIKEATESGFKLFARRILHPWLAWDSVFNLFYGKQIQAIQDCWNFMSEDIKKAVEKLDNNTNNYRKSNKLSSTKEENDGKQIVLTDIYQRLQEHHTHITRQDFKDEAITVIGGGSDVVAVTTSSCLLALAAHPHVQDKLYTEIVEVVGSQEGYVTSDDIRNMPYLDCVLKETMRRFTVVPFILRKNSEQLKLRGCTVPPNSTIGLNILGQNMDPKNYPEPEIFDPDRFSPENTALRNRYSYIPFCSGPRDCLGKPYAKLLVKILLVTLLRRFKVSTIDDINRLTFRYEMILVSQSGYNVAFDERQPLQG